MIYRFGACELDASTGELRRDGRPVALQPKPLALLTLLIEERHRIVPNDELLDRLWPGESVTPSSLSRAVSVARGAIGDAGRSGRIRSYTRRGYRFHGDVIELDADTRGSDPSGATAADAGAPLAGGIPFVGREEALARLRAAWSRAARGGAGIVLVSGAAGIGKTRLVEVVEREVAQRGGLVLRGRALEEEGEPAYWVWAQMLRRMLEEDPESLRVPGLADSGELAALMPELQAEAPGAAARLPAEQRRFVFFDAVARALRRAADRRPLLVSFEDLHWADPASLRLLEHLAFELTGAPVLLVATVRDAPAPPADDPSLRTLSVLRRCEHLERVSLDPLDAAAVATLVERLAGRPIPDLAERLHARTEGLPLFLREACRRLEEVGALADPTRLGDELPLARVDWVRETLRGLSGRCAKLVGAAATLGREFGLPMAAATAEIPREEALDLLDEAVREGVVEADPQAPARYRFVHDLFREAAYDDLPPGERVRLHHRAARQLEKQQGGCDDRVAELAHHHHRALAVGDPERAYACATQAAEAAFAVCAYEQAAMHGRQALAALEYVEGAVPERRLATLLQLGEASRLAGERRARRRHFGEALELARALEDPEAFATAAIGLCDLAEWGVRDDLARAAVEEALERLVHPAPELEAKLLTRLGYLDAMFDRETAEALLRRAVALTRELGASDPLEEALYALHLVLGGPEGLEERLHILDELRGAASAARDPVASVIAVLDVACDRLELGEAGDAARLRREADATAGQPPHPRTLWHRCVYDTGLALLEGRLDEVEGRAEEAYALGRRLEHPYAAGCYTGHRTHLLELRGEPEKLLVALEPALAARQGPTDWVKLRVARARAAVGRRGEARALYDEVLARGPEGIPRNLRWIATMVELAHCCADLEDAAGAAAIARALRPFEHHHGVLPMVICYGGPVAWALARLHEIRGHADDANDLYADALEAARALGARPTEAQIRVSHAALLHRRAKRSEARAQLAAAAALAADLGMPGVERAACAAMEA